MSMKMVWDKYIERREVGFVYEMLLFDAMGRSIVCYAAQIWRMQKKRESRNGLRRKF